MSRADRPSLSPRPCPSTRRNSPSAPLSGEPARAARLRGRPPGPCPVLPCLGRIPLGAPPMSRADRPPWRPDHVLQRVATPPPRAPFRGAGARSASEGSSAWSVPSAALPRPHPPRRSAHVPCRSSPLGAPFRGAGARSATEGSSSPCRLPPLIEKPRIQRSRGPAPPGRSPKLLTNPTEGYGEVRKPPHFQSDLAACTSKLHFLGGNAGVSGRK